MVIDGTPLDVVKKGQRRTLLVRSRPYGHELILRSPDELEVLGRELIAHAERWRRETTPRRVKNAVMDEALRDFTPSRKRRAN